MGLQHSGTQHDTGTVAATWHMASMNVPLLYRHILVSAAAIAVSSVCHVCAMRSGSQGHSNPQKAAQKFPSIKRQALIADIKLDFRDNKVTYVTFCTVSGCVRCLAIRQEQRSTPPTAHSQHACTLLCRA